MAIAISCHSRWPGDFGGLMLTHPIFGSLVACRPKGGSVFACGYVAPADIETLGAVVLSLLAGLRFGLGV